MEIMKVCISKGNSKMGAIPSASLPPVKTCRPNCPCDKTCYIRKLMLMRPSLRKSYENNLKILLENPDEYWRQVNEAVHLSRFFRFHVSGDIPNREYLERMVKVAIDNPHCEILCFTKQYEIVNDLVGNGGVIPENLHIVFSGWRGLPMDNPYNFPEAHVRFKDGYCEAREDAVECYGNCVECCVAGCGCWKLKHGEQVVFKQH